MTSSDPPAGRPKADTARSGVHPDTARPGVHPDTARSGVHPDTARGAAQARFIPREALGGFAAWRPGDIAGGPAPQTNVHRTVDEAPVADAAARHAAELRAARDAGYQDGYRDGLVALDGFKQSFAAQTTRQVGALLQSLEAELAGLQQNMARTLAVTATHLARQVVRCELQTQPQLIAAVAGEALNTLLLNAQHITLRVHPDDHALVAQGAAEVLAARGARLLTDATLTRGGVLVESDIGVVDATLEARWRRAVAALGCEEPWSADIAADNNTNAEPDPHA